MPGQAPFHTDERDVLLGYVDQQRAVLHITAYGLTDEQARTPAAAPSPLTVGGLIKHVAKVEQNWIDMILERERPATAEDDYVENFTMRPDETLSEVIAAAVAVGEETTRVVRGIDDLGQRVPVTAGGPLVPRRPRRLVGTVGVDARRHRDRPARRPRRHRPRSDRRCHRLPAHGRGRGLAGNAMDAAVGTGLLKERS